MKFLIKIFFVPFIAILFSGCYTTLWLPDGDYDSEDFSANDTENYYPETNYGGYYYYYNRPWWYNAVQATQEAKNRTKDSNSLRNADGSRTFTRQGRNTQQNQPNAPLPATSAPAATSSSANTSTTSNSGNRVENTSSSSSSDNNRSSSNSNPVRNNDGNRNTSGR